MRREGGRLARSKFFGAMLRLRYRAFHVRNSDDNMPTHIPWLPCKRMVGSPTASARPGVCNTQTPTLLEYRHSHVFDCATLPEKSLPRAGLSFRLLEPHIGHRWRVAGTHGSCPGGRRRVEGLGFNYSESGRASSTIFSPLVVASFHCQRLGSTLCSCGCRFAK